MQYGIKCRKKNCINCGKKGHEFKMCQEPITSYGIINFDIIDKINENLVIEDKFSIKKNINYRIISKKYPNIKCTFTDAKFNNINLYKLNNYNIPFESDEDLFKFSYYKEKISFMMVSRRHSLGFTEFVRGRYDVTNAKTIINLFEQMYHYEIKFIKKNKYDDILYYFLNRNGDSKETFLKYIYDSKYSNEYNQAKIKFNLLLNAESQENEIPLKLEFYTKYIKPKWNYPEWGFPKGRREKNAEENIECACREFEEETGYNKNDYQLLNKVEPIEEKLVGTNGVVYKHIYYLSVNNKNRDCRATNYDTHEIGEIKWFTYEEAMKNIRPYHHEKKKILTKVYLFILNYLIHNTNVFL